MDVDAEIRAEQEARKRGVGLADVVEDDVGPSGGGGLEYVRELRDEGEGDDDAAAAGYGSRSGSLAQRVIAAHALDAEGEGTAADLRSFGGTLANTRIADRESEVGVGVRVSLRRGVGLRVQSPRSGGHALEDTFAVSRSSR